jgi:hypothetical protein
MKNRICIVLMLILLFQINTSFEVYPFITHTTSQNFKYLSCNIFLDFENTQPR